MFFRSNIVRLGGSPVALLQQTFVVSNQGEMIVADLRTEVSKGSAAIKAAMEGLAAAAPGMLVKVNRGSQLFQQGPSFRRIMRVAGRQGERYDRSSIRGNQMNLGIPSATGFPNGLWPVFFKAPVPSGCTFTDVESSEKASMLMRTICSSWSCSNTRSNTPFLAHRFIRM